MIIMSKLQVPILKDSKLKLDCKFKKDNKKRIKNQVSWIEWDVKFREKLNNNIW